jgi:betaine lipid synthase
MLRLCVAQLSNDQANTKKPLIWVDIGGGTGLCRPPYYVNGSTLIRNIGWNIESMNEFLPISSFDAIYLIDLCEPLLELARKRFEEKGWKNVFVLCQDASNFTLPDWGPSFDPKGSINFVTMSYSVTMVICAHL